MSMSIVITGLAEACKRFNVDIMQIVRPAAVVIGEEIRNELATYPGPVSHPIKWASVKQRRWYFAHRREAGLPIGYTRNSDPESQRLGPSWTVTPTATGAVVGTRATYAPWVQDAEQQSPQHKATGWMTDQVAVQNVVQSGVVVDAVVAAIQAAFRR